VYNADLVRQLCGEIVKENDPEKAKDLISLLQAVIKDDQDEVRIRMAFLAKKYVIVANSKLAD
jgi:hypothetical protein